MYIFKNNTCVSHKKYSLLQIYIVHEYMVRRKVFFKEIDYIPKTLLAVCDNIAFNKYIWDRIPYQISTILVMLRLNKKQTKLFWDKPKYSIINISDSFHVTIYFQMNMDIHTSYWLVMQAQARQTLPIFRNLMAEVNLRLAVTQYAGKGVVGSHS